MVQLQKRHWIVLKGDQYIDLGSTDNAFDFEVVIGNSGFLQSVKQNCPCPVLIVEIQSYFATKTFMYHFKFKIVLKLFQHYEFYKLIEILSNHAVYRRK